MTETSDLKPKDANQPANQPASRAAGRWVIRDHGRPICTVLAHSREQAIEQFCRPALEPDAYFSAKGGWTCETWP
jgi:hypothetical protein